MSAVTSQSLSTALTVISANIEGLTADKAFILSEMCKREYCHCLCPQETHRSTNLPRPKIAGMSLVVERPHSKYGSAILIRNDLKVKKIYERVQGIVELITIVMRGVVVHSVYKPPNDPLGTPSSGPQKPTTYCDLRFQQPQYYVGLHKHRYRRISGRTVGRFVRFYTHL